MADRDDWFERGVWRARGPLALEHVMDTWMQLASECEPLDEMPRDDRAGGIRRLVAALLDMEHGVGDVVRRQRIGDAALRHGAFRRDQRCPADVVLLDFVTLRDALTSVALATDAAEESLRAVVRALVADCAAARRYALMAYEE